MNSNTNLKTYNDRSKHLSPPSSLSSPSSSSQFTVICRHNSRDWYKRWLEVIGAVGICGLLIFGSRATAIPQNVGIPQSEASQWTELPTASPSKDGRSIDIAFPYATKANFVRTQLYPCARCFLRPEVAAAVRSAHQKLQQQGYGGLRVFDCYRPHQVQRKMWQILPDSRYVGNPARGSDHNRGMAVDLTIVDRSGKPLDMGTPFDEFSTKAHHTYRQLPPPVLKHRELLKQTMMSVGFRSIDTEWWHYAWQGKKAAIGDWIWKCSQS